MPDLGLHFGGLLDGAKVSKPMSTGSAQRGLWKLMLKLPAMRGQLQLLNARSASMVNLCDAFDEATSTLDRLRKEPLKNAALIKEYEILCTDIEGEIIDLCINTRNSSA